MPAPEHDNRRQKAVLWTRKGVNRQGQLKLNSPAEIIVRWKWVKREIVDRQGNTVAIDAEVVTVQDIPVGSVLWLGSVDDLPGGAPSWSDAWGDSWSDAWGSEEAGGGLPTEDVMQVITAPTTPDIKGRFKMRTLMLMRMKDTMPEV